MLWERISYIIVCIEAVTLTSRNMVYKGTLYSGGGYFLKTLYIMVRMVFQSTCSGAMDLYILYYESIWYRSTYNFDCIKNTLDKYSNDYSLQLHYTTASRWNQHATTPIPLEIVEPVLQCQTQFSKQLRMASNAPCHTYTPIPWLSASVN